MQKTHKQNKHPINQTHKSHYNKNKTIPNKQKKAHIKFKHTQTTHTITNKKHPMQNKHPQNKQQTPHTL
jgi:hypothetical protein